MKIKLHHVNVCSKDVPGLADFYRDVLDLKPEPSLEKGRSLDKDGYPGKVAFLSDGETQFHLAEKDYGISFRTGQAVNPVLNGHIAFRTDDITRTDIAINYSFKWPIMGHDLEFFLQPEVLNLFNEDGVEAVNTTVQTAVNTAGLSRFNPFTQTPVEGVHWRRQPASATQRGFGQPRNDLDYQLPRTFRFSTGVRF